MLQKPLLDDINRYFKINDAIVFRRRHLPRTHIDLHGRQQQYRHFQCRIALGAHGHKLIFTHAIVNMDIVCTLFRNRALPLGRAIVGRLVVTHEQSCIRRKIQQLTDRAVQLTGVATWKIGACSTDIGHK